MPSNAMKISQLIEQLEGLKAFHGDLDVVLALPGADALVAIDGRNVNVDGEALGKKLPQPALIIGLWRDAKGVMTNMPGQRYQATADATGWNHTRSEAPEGVDLKVWKRYGGQDIGKRVGDQWYVREGAAEWPARPIEIIPAGILAWKHAE